MKRRHEFEFTAKRTFQKKAAGEEGGTESFPSMHATVTCSAERDEIFLCIVPGAAAEFPMVNLEIRHRTATLASPSIAAQYLVSQLLVGFDIEAKSLLFQDRPDHDAFSVI